jgi:hypothetical protein
MRGSLADRVAQVHEDSMYRVREVSPRSSAPQIPDDGLKVRCLSTGFIFHPQRVKANAAKIFELCSELSDSYRWSHGGFTFAQLCFTRTGYLWTQDPRDCEYLLSLAIAIDNGGILLEPADWSKMPFGIPYVWIGR